MKNSSLLGGVLVLIGALCFSTTGFTQALIVDDGASSYAIGTIRMLFGGLLLLALLQGGQVFFFHGQCHRVVPLGRSVRPKQIVEVLVLLPCIDPIGIVGLVLVVKEA